MTGSRESSPISSSSKGGGAGERSVGDFEERTRAFVLFSHPAATAMMRDSHSTQSEGKEDRFVSHALAILHDGANAFLRLLTFLREIERRRMERKGRSQILSLFDTRPSLIVMNYYTNFFSFALVNFVNIAVDEIFAAVHHLVLPLLAREDLQAVLPLHRNLSSRERAH